MRGLGGRSNPQTPCCQGIQKSTKLYKKNFSLTPQSPSPINYENFRVGTSIGLAQKPGLFANNWTKAFNPGKKPGFFFRGAQVSIEQKKGAVKWIKFYTDC